MNKEMFSVPCQNIMETELHLTGKVKNFSFVFFFFTINQIRMQLITSTLEIRRGATFFCFDLRDDLRLFRLDFQF